VANEVERADIARALFEEVHVRDRAIVRVKLADDTLLPVLAAYMAAEATGAPPDGFEPPIPTQRPGLVSRGWVSGLPNPFVITARGSASLGSAGGLATALGA
jgi:hypothetical protein